MPIANCIITPDCVAGTIDLIEVWANESGQSPEYMAINIMNSNDQFGYNYKVMANLYLPSLWSGPNASALQMGLAKVLSKYFKQAIDQVHIVTTIVESGMVVEAGQEQKWSPEKLNKRSV